jgi:hypothetical protein
LLKIEQQIVGVGQDQEEKYAGLTSEVELLKEKVEKI